MTAACGYQGFGSGDHPTGPWCVRPKGHDGPCSTSDAFESAHPEIRSEPAERLGREGMVTVWDAEGRYVGCMGVELWRHLLTVETK